MKNFRKYVAGLCAIVMSVGFTVVNAQTVANGPYYATPSWDQTLPVATRFIVLSNFAGAAVLDRETGLVWEKSPDTPSTTWAVAQRSCNQKTVGGRKGWRLPTIQDLASLIDPTVPLGPTLTLPIGHPFINVQSSPAYWSATSESQSPSTIAWDVLFSAGVVNITPKSASQPVWCVRGGQGVDPQ